MTLEKSNRPLSRLFVGSLPYNLTEGQLLELFAPFGRVISVMLIRRFGKSRGAGYVEFDNPDSALAAKQKMHNHPIYDRTIIVDFAKPDPFLTPEGQARHQQALSRKNARHPKRNEGSILKLSTPRHNSKFGGKSEKSVKSRSGYQHIRQSVYNSRYHGARVGAKFAQRSQKKR